MLRSLILSVVLISASASASAASLQFSTDQSNYGKTLVEAHPLGRAVKRWEKEASQPMTYLSIQIDLNQDRQPEFLVLLRHPKTCDQYGCMVVGFMYDKNVLAENAAKEKAFQAKVAEAKKAGMPSPRPLSPKSAWNIIFNNKGKSLEVMGRNPKTGMNDLLVDGKEVWAWDGTRYDVKQ